MEQVSNRQKHELARRKAMPIALIQKPLKVIRKICGISRVSAQARDAADRGNGAYVRHLARWALSL